jgi:hypothetical protein
MKTSKNNLYGVCFVPQDNIPVVDTQEPVDQCFRQYQVMYAHF